MANALYNACDALNMPFNTIRMDEICDDAVYVCNCEPDLLRGGDYSEVVTGIYVENRLANMFNADYFNTSIEGKDVYVGLFLYGGYLPVARPSKFQVVEKGATPADSDWEYKKVCFDDEKSIGELYRNAHCYQYNADTDTYLKLPNSGALQNKLKLYMQKRIMEIGGDAYDRIADLSRIMLFLLTKVTLTEEERGIIAPVLSYAQSALQLADVFNREKHIQSYVAHVKADPGGYIDETTEAISFTDTNTDEPEL